MSKRTTMHRVSVNAQEQEMLEFLKPRFPHAANVPELFRAILGKVYQDEKDADRRYRVGATDRAVSRGTREERIKRLRAMTIDQLNDELQLIGYFKPEKELGDGTVERERIVSHETTGAPVLATQTYDPSMDTVTYEATTLTLDQVIAELVKQKLI